MAHEILMRMPKKARIDTEWFERLAQVYDTLNLVTGQLAKSGAMNDTQQNVAGMSIKEFYRLLVNSGVIDEARSPEWEDSF